MDMLCIMNFLQLIPMKSFNSRFYCEMSSTNMYFLSLDAITSTYEKHNSGDKSLVIIVGIVIPVVLIIAVTVAVFFYKKVR